MDEWRSCLRNGKGNCDIEELKKVIRTRKKLLAIGMAFGFGVVVCCVCTGIKVFNQQDEQAEVAQNDSEDTERGQLEKVDYVHKNYGSKTQIEVKTKK